MIYAIVLLGATAAICAVQWLKYYIASLTLMIFMQRKNYTPPSDEETAECRAYVIRNLVKDATGKQ
ncbi:MAG: hypothetical protein LUG45_05405 [Clostridiales bacterium]|nr:hypothetical protein [Clostridiales bacterium]